MGSWGIGPFENDDAGDWSGDIDQSGDPLASLTELFAQVLQAEYVEVDATNQVVAAAAWLASGVPDGPSVSSSYSPDSDPPAVDADLADQALAAVAKATEETSEWHELWDEAGEVEEALAALEPALEALRSVTS